ncbi:hypothetical protein Tco_1204694, partial [Tanacetum coccineum]
MAQIQLLIDQIGRSLDHLCTASGPGYSLVAVEPVTGDNSKVRLREVKGIGLYVFRSFECWFWVWGRVLAEVFADIPADAFRNSKSGHLARIYYWHQFKNILGHQFKTVLGHQFKNILGHQGIMERSYVFADIPADAFRNSKSGHLARIYY